MKEFNPTIEKKSINIVDVDCEILEYICQEIREKPVEKDMGDGYFEVSDTIHIKVAVYEMDIQYRKVEEYSIIPCTHELPETSELIGVAIYDLDVALWDGNSGCELDFTYTTSKDEYPRDEFTFKIEQLCTK